MTFSDRQVQTELHLEYRLSKTEVAGTFDSGDFSDLYFWSVHTSIRAFSFTTSVWGVLLTRERKTEIIRETPKNVDFRRKSKTQNRFEKGRATLS